MFKQWAQIRPSEGRDTAIATLTLFGVMMAHSVLEAARDAMFLSAIAATRLPLVYLAVAGAALGLAALQSRSKRRPGSRRLAMGLVLAAGVTASFGQLARQDAPWTLYALYVWSAMLVSTVVAQFFILLGERFTVSQAKRLYTVVGAGSVAGAIVGSGTASVLASIMPARELLLISAGALLLCSVGPFLLERTDKPNQAEAGSAHQGLGQIWQVVVHPYAGRVAALVVTATMTFTLVDYVFKSAVVAHVEPGQLGLYFARIYLVLNVLSLVVQLIVVRWVVRSVSVAAAIAILPALLLLGGGVIMFGGVLLGSLAVKSVDGALRYSLHRTVSELLYLPMGRRLRAASKVTIDLIGQRLGQALASVVILAVVGLGAGPVWLGGGVVAMTALWIGQAIALRGHYLDLFRHSLKDAAERSPKDFPKLDVSSLESIMAALNSPNESEVRAALTFLEEQGRTRAIPGLILYHPSPDVLVDALDILGKSKRDDFLHITERLLDHEYAAVRAAALRARIARVFEEDLLREKAEVNCPVVRATALVGLAADARTSDGLGDVDFDAIIDNGSEIAKEALAKAIHNRPAARFEAILERLVRDDSTLVALAAIEAMMKQPTERSLPVLLPLLARRQLRGAVRDCLAQIGQPAFDHLAHQLTDGTLDESVLLHIPRSLSRFEPGQASRVLLTALGKHPNSAVRYKILRGLGGLAAENSDIVLDRGALLEFAMATATAMFGYIDCRTTLERGKVENPLRGTEAHELLVTLLKDKERNARERLFRTLGLMFPEQDIATIYRGLHGRSHEMAASSRELLESFLRPPALRTAVLGLVDDAPDSVRMAASGTLYERVALTYEQLLGHLLETPSESLRGFAVYQIGELRLTELRPQVLAINAPPDGFLAQVIKRTAVSIAPPNGGTAR